MAAIRLRHSKAMNVPVRKDEGRPGLDFVQRVPSEFSCNLESGSLLKSLCIALWTRRGALQPLADLNEDCPLTKPRTRAAH
jgi:hypothetical protein